MLVYSVPNSSKTCQRGQFLQEREEPLHQTKQIIYLPILNPVKKNLNDLCKACLGNQNL